MYSGKLGNVTGRQIAGMLSLDWESRKVLWGRDTEVQH